MNTEEANPVKSNKSARRSKEERSQHRLNPTGLLLDSARNRGCARPGPWGVASQRAGTSARSCLPPVLSSVTETPEVSGEDPGAEGQTLPFPGADLLNPGS